ncbi:hypothetical protein [Erwinia phage COW86c]
MESIVWVFQIHVYLHPKWQRWWTPASKFKTLLQNTTFLLMVFLRTILYRQSLNYVQNNEYPRHFSGARISSLWIHSISVFTD